MAANRLTAVGSSKEGVCTRVALDLVGLCEEMEVSDARMAVNATPMIIGTINTQTLNSNIISIG
jgi:hypothetical protein